MVASADLLWRVNNEYRKRLSEASKYLGLLEQLIESRPGDNHYHLIHLIRHTHEQLDLLIEEHRGWRYSYFYDSADSKRMVQTERDINRALAYFSRMRVRHEQLLRAVYRTVDEFPPPEAQMVCVENANLWRLMMNAIYHLNVFISQPEGTLS